MVLRNVTTIESLERKRSGHAEHDVMQLEFVLNLL
jgi:hypothetical protein